MRPSVHVLNNGDATSQGENMKKNIKLDQNDQDLRENLSNLTKKSLNHILRIIGEKCYNNKHAIHENDNDVNNIRKGWFLEQAFNQLSTIRDFNDDFKFPEILLDGTHYNY